MMQGVVSDQDSLRQYKSQIKNWKWEKNVKGEEMAKMVRIQTARRQEGKETVFKVRGMEVPSKKIERWLKVNGATPPPLDIEFYTPAPTPRDSGCIIEQSESDDDGTPHASQVPLLPDANPYMM
jgi:hypothetical protein